MIWHWSYQSDITIYKVHNLLQRGNIWHDIGLTGQTPPFTRFRIYCNEKIWHDIGLTGQTPPFTRFTIYCNEKIYDIILVLPVRHQHLPGSQFIAMRKYMTWHWSYQSDITIYQVHNLLQRKYMIWHWSYRSNTPIYQVNNLLQWENMTWYWSYRSDTPIYQVHNLLQWENMTWYWSYRSDTPIYQVHNLLQWENIWHDIGLTGQTPPHLPGSQFPAHKVEVNL